MEDPLSVGSSVLGAFQQLGAALRMAADVFGAGFPPLTQLTQDLERSIRVGQLDGEQATRMPEGPANVQAHKHAERAGDVTRLCSILREKSTSILHKLDQINKNHRGRSKLLYLALKQKELEQQLQVIKRILEQLQTLVRKTLPPSVDRDIPKGLMQRETPKASGKGQEHVDFIPKCALYCEIAA